MLRTKTDNRSFTPPKASCYPRSQRRGLGHPDFCQIFHFTKGSYDPDAFALAARHSVVQDHGDSLEITLLGNQWKMLLDDGR